MHSPTLTPVRLDWLQAAAILPGKSLHIALLLYTLCSRRGLPLVHLTRRMLDGVSRDALYDGLVNVSRLPGRAHQITLLEPGTDRALRMASGQAGVKPDMGVYR
jgi:hypothetical protein